MKHYLMVFIGLSSSALLAPPPIGSVPPAPVAPRPYLGPIQQPPESCEARLRKANKQIKSIMKDNIKTQDEIIDLFDFLIGFPFLDYKSDYEYIDFIKQDIINLLDYLGISNARSKNTLSQIKYGITSISGQIARLQMRIDQLEAELAKSKASAQKQEE